MPFSRHILLDITNIAPHWHSRCHGIRLDSLQLHLFICQPATSRVQGFATTPAPLRTSKQDILLPPSSKQSERSFSGSLRNRPLYRTSTADLFCPCKLANYLLPVEARLAGKSARACCSSVRGVNMYNTRDL